MKAVFGAALLVLAASIVQADEREAATLTLPAGGGMHRLRVEVQLAGQSPAVPWQEFLGEFLAYFDRDGDGRLSREEAERAPALPLPQRRTLKFDFAALDANADGGTDLVELTEYCRAGGFTPVVAVVAPPAAEDQQLAALWLGGLDADGDGRLSSAELRQAPYLLRRFDRDENEFLEAVELIDEPLAAGTGETPVALVAGGDPADATLRLDLNPTAPGADYADGARENARALPVVGGRAGLPADDGSWRLTLDLRRTAPDVEAAGEFLVAQFRDALADAPALELEQIARDPGLSGLVELSRLADRKGDGRLEVEELKSYLRLVARGMQAQVWITAADRGGNPFPDLDRDGDGRWSYVELAQAAETVGGNAASPRHVQLSFGGPQVKAWGGAPIPKLARRLPLPSLAKSDAPRWFQALDRNRDGVVSPGEFAGPPGVWRRLDADGNGWLSGEEAKAQASP